MAQESQSKVKRSAIDNFNRLAILSNVSNEGAFIPRSIRLRKSTVFRASTRTFNPGVSTNNRAFIASTTAGIHSSVCARKPDYKVGDKIRVNLHRGKIEDAVIRAVIEHKDGLKLQVDFGHEQTALINAWQVVKD